MSGLIACFPAGPERPSNSSGAGGAPAGTATGPERAGSGPSSGAWASGTHLQGSEEGGPLPFGAGGAAADSVAAVAALLRQAGVRAPAGMGDSTAMLSATASAGGGGGVGASLASEGSGTLSASHSRQLHTIGARVTARGAAEGRLRAPRSAPLLARRTRALLRCAAGSLLLLRVVSQTRGAPTLLEA